MALPVSDRAIILQIKPYRETSAIVSILTEHNGLLRGILRGNRGLQTGRKKGMILQGISLSNISFTGRSDLKTITRVDTVQQYKISASLLTHSVLLAELCHKLLPPGQEEGVIFDLLHESLLILAGSNVEPDEVVINFIVRLLDNQGYDLLSEGLPDIGTTDFSDYSKTGMNNSEVLLNLEKVLKHYYPKRPINTFRYITRKSYETRG
jgi:DNA repair protein RecO (recombination protein O)